MLSGFWIPWKMCNLTALFFFPTTYIKNYREQLTKKSLSEQPLTIILYITLYNYIKSLVHLRLLFFSLQLCLNYLLWTEEWQHCSCYFLYIDTFVCASSASLIFLGGDKQFLPIDVFLHLKWSLALDFLNDTSSTLLTCSIINMKRSTADIYCIMFTGFSRTI